MVTTFQSLLNAQIKCALQFSGYKFSTEGRLAMYVTMCCNRMSSCCYRIRNNTKHILEPMTVEQIVHGVFLSFFCLFTHIFIILWCIFVLHCFVPPTLNYWFPWTKPKRTKMKKGKMNKNFYAFHIDEILFGNVMREYLFTVVWIFFICSLQTSVNKCEAAAQNLSNN